MHFLVKITFLGMLVAAALVKEILSGEENEPTAVQPRVIHDAQEVIQYFKESSRIVALHESSGQAQAAGRASTSTGSFSRAVPETEDDIFCKSNPAEDEDALELRKDVCRKVLKALELTLDYINIDKKDKMRCQNVEFSVEDSAYTTFQKIPCPHMNTGRRLKVYITYLDYSPISNSYAFCTFVERSDKTLTVGTIVDRVVLGGPIPENDEVRLSSGDAI